MKSGFKYLTLLSALALAGGAAYLSIIGLGQLFAGASMIAMIVAGILEFGKIIGTTFLHKYWGEIHQGLRGYMTIGVIGMMTITSAGVYGFFSNAYQKTANSLEIHDSEIGILESKGSYFEKTIEVNEKNISTKYKRMEQLGELRTTQERRVDSTNTGWRKRQYLNDIKATNKEIQNLTADIDLLNVNNQGLNDSINVYQVKVLELDSSSEVAGEVGPLKYLSELTDKPMGDIANYLILLLIFLFDPFAIAMIIGTSWLFERDNGKTPPVKSTPPVAPSTPTITLPVDRPPAPVEPITNNVVSGGTEPVVKTGKVELGDIKEVKDREKAFSLPTPQRSNTIERIGSNKLVKDGDNKKLFFKRR